jgi:hypothetical protein
MEEDFISKNDRELYTKNLVFREWEVEEREMTKDEEVKCSYTNLQKWRCEISGSTYHPSPLCLEGGPIKRQPDVQTVSTPVTHPHISTLQASITIPNFMGDTTTTRIKVAARQ